MRKRMPVHIGPGRFVLPAMVTAAVLLLSVNLYAIDFPETTTTLQQAALAGQSGKVKSLLAGGAPVDATNPQGWTALMYAAVSGDLSTVKVLLSANAYVGAKSYPSDTENAGVTALMLAAAIGSVPVVLELLKSGAKADMTDVSGQTPLAYAATAGQLGAARVLLAAGAVPTPDAVNNAAITNHPELLQAMIAAGADVNAKGEGGRTPLMEAVLRSYPQVVALLLRAGADPRQKDDEGLDIVSYAALATPQIVGLLLDNKLDPKGRQAQMLLQTEVTAGKLQAVRVLLFHGTPPDGLLDEKSRTDLMIAAKNGYADIAGALLAAGADRSLKDASGKTALELASNDATRTALTSAAQTTSAQKPDAATSLYTAIQSGNKAAVQALLNKGVDPNSTLHGFSMLALAASMGATEVVQQLLEAGGNPNELNAQGETPLMYAVVQDRVDAVRALIAAGANVNLKTAEGETALSLAQDPTVRALLQAAGGR